MRPFDILAGLGVLICWGLTFPIAKIGIAELPPLTMISLRYVLTAVLLAPFLRVPKHGFGLVIVISIALGGFHFPLMFSGVAGVDAAVAAIVMQAQSPFAVILAVVILGERLTALRLFGLLVAFGGVAMLAGEPADQSSLLHIVLLVVSAFAWAIASLLIKRVPAVGVFQLNAWIALLAIPQVAIASWVLERGQIEAIMHASLRGWGTVFFLALGGTIIGWGGISYLLKRYPVSRVTPIALAIPVVGISAAVILLDEPLTYLRLVAALLTVIGVAIVMFAPARRTTAPPVES